MRIILTLFLIVSFISKAVWIALTTKGAEKQRRLSENATRHAKKLIPLYKVTLSTEGSFPKGGYLVAANHVSYIDVLMLSALHPSLYISYTRIQRIFFVGGIASLGATLFLERDKKHMMRQDILSITNMLKSGNPVTIFPEGRCTNGDGVMDFHGGYIEAAIDAGIPVVPVCVTYKKFNGKALGAANRDFLFIYGKTPFGPHIVRLIRQLKSLELSVRIFPPIESGGKDRKQIAMEAFQNVSGYYRENSPLSAGLPEV